MPMIDQSPQVTMRKRVERATSYWFSLFFVVVVAAAQLHVGESANYPQRTPTTSLSKPRRILHTRKDRRDGERGIRGLIAAEKLPCFTDSECEVGSFCKYLQNEETFCGLDGKHGNCELIPESCSPTSNGESRGVGTVCGCDGRSYSTSCEATLSGTSIKNEGACIGEESCVCPSTFEPVCGADAKTYRNPCEAQCGGTHVKLARPCASMEQGDIPCNCKPSFEPVCGQDNNTYENECSMNCIKGRKRTPEEKVQRACLGKCPCSDESCFCPELIDPVCGDDGRTYRNGCEANCVGIEAECKGACPCLPDCACPQEDEPVCTVTVEAFANACEAQCAKAEVLCFGECPCPDDIL